MDLSPPTLAAIQDNLKGRNLSANNLGSLLGLSEDRLKPHLEALVKEKKIKASTAGKGARVLYGIV